MGYPFLSEAWIAESRRRVDASPEFRQAAKGMDAAFLSVITNVPDGGTLYLLLEFVEGRIRNLELGRNGSLAERSVTFRVTGTYDTFAQLQRGQLTVQAAYFRGLVKLQGNASQALRYAPAFLKYHEIVRTVETEF